MAALHAELGPFRPKSAHTLPSDAELSAGSADFRPIADKIGAVGSSATFLAEFWTESAFDCRPARVLSGEGELPPESSSGKAGDELAVNPGLEGVAGAGPLRVQPVATSDLRSRSRG